MSELVRNPEDRSSHNETRVTINDFHLASSVSRGRSIGDVMCRLQYTDRQVYHYGFFLSRHYTGQHSS